MKHRLILIATLLILCCFALLVACAIESGNGEETATEIESTDCTGSMETAPDLSAQMPIDGSVYKITSICNDGVLESYHFGMGDGYAVQVNEYVGDLNQLWRFHLNEDSTYCIENLSAGRYLALMRDTKENGTGLVVTSADPAASAQRFKVMLNEDGTYKLLTSHNKALQCSSDEIMGEENPVIQNSVSDRSQQVFKIEFICDESVELPQMLQLSGDTDLMCTPEIVKCNGKYYCYGFKIGIPYTVSSDLKHWELGGYSFTTEDKMAFDWMKKMYPEWVAEQWTNGGMWVPGVYYFGGKYYMYYALSKNGAPKSTIGMAWNMTLDPSSPDFKWVDGGPVLSTDYNVGGGYNCIDPFVYVDDAGEPWLAYGSWFKGVGIRKLDKETGLLPEGDETVYQIAYMSSGSLYGHAIEACWIIKKDGYYYQFNAVGPMDERYHNVVSRSETLTGTYYSRDGVSNVSDGDRTVTAEMKEGVYCPAHCSVFQDDDGQYYMIGEYYWPDESPFQAYISTIVWDDEGWPYTALSPNVLELLD